MSETTEMNQEAETGGQEYEAQAREMGWSPKESFKGDPERWVDAKTFVERGEIVMPILKAHNRKLNEQVGTLTSQLGEANAAIKVLQEGAEEMARLQYKRALETLKKQKADARAEGDASAEVEIDEAIAELREKGPRTATKPAETKPVIIDVNSEYFSEFRDRNSDWLDVNQKLTNFAFSQTQMYAKEGLKGSALLKRVEEDVRELFPKQRREARSDKMEGSGGGAGHPANRMGNGKTWNDLPVEAKAIADRQEKYLVGPGKMHKDRAAWRASYLQQYFAE